MLPVAPRLLAFTKSEAPPIACSNQGRFPDFSGDERGAVRANSDLVDFRSAFLRERGRIPLRRGGAVWGARGVCGWRCCRTRSPACRARSASRVTV